MTDAIEPREPTEASAAYAHAVDQRIRTTVRVLKGAWIALAQDLYEFKQAEMWRDLGFSGFEAWMSDPGVEIEMRWAYDVLAMWQQLVIDREVEPSRLQQIQISKVREVLPAIRRGMVTVDEGLNDAETLRRSDLEERYRGKASDGKTAGPDTSTVVRTAEEPEWVRCAHCGSLTRRRTEET